MFSNKALHRCGRGFLCCIGMLLIYTAFWGRPLAKRLVTAQTRNLHLTDELRRLRHEQQIQQEALRDEQQEWAKLKQASMPSAPTQAVGVGQTRERFAEATSRLMQQLEESQVKWISAHPTENELGYDLEIVDSFPRVTSALDDILSSSSMSVSQLSMSLLNAGPTDRSGSMVTPASTAARCRWSIRFTREALP